MSVWYQNISLNTVTQIFYVKGTEAEQDDEAVVSIATWRYFSEYNSDQDTSKLSLVEDFLVMKIWKESALN